MYFNHPVPTSGTEALRFMKSDNYCMCTPSLAVEGLIEYQEDPKDEESVKVILIRRRDPPVDKYAIPGGF
eukprot:gene4925-6159_t